jgi:hypothetical protein
VFWCALGFFAGAVVTDWLAAYASVTFARSMRVAYQTEQEQLAACATERGDLDDAVVHHGNAVAAATRGGTAPNAFATRSWPLGFSFMAAAFEIFVSTERLDNLSEASERAQLARALEHAGRYTEAKAEYDRAARLSGGDVRATRRSAAAAARVNAELARRADPVGCYFRRTAGTAGVGASSSIR